MMSVGQYPHPLVQMMVSMQHAMWARETQGTALEPKEDDSPVVAKLRAMCGEKHQRVCIDSSHGEGGVAARFHGDAFEELLNGPLMTLDDLGGWPVVHFLPWFNKHLRVTEASEEFQRRLDEFTENGDETLIVDGKRAIAEEIPWLICDWHAEFLKQRCEDRYRQLWLDYTYNYSDTMIFDRDFQYLHCYDDEAEETLFAISLHTGCDARWGFTRFQCFSVEGDWHDGNVCYFLNPDVMFQQVYPDSLDPDQQPLDPGRKTEQRPCPEYWESYFSLAHDDGAWDAEQKTWFWTDKNGAKFEVEACLNEEW